MSDHRLSFWELDEEGRELRTVSGAGWLRPADASLEGDYVRWSQWMAKEDHAAWVRPGPGLLTDFVGLRSGKREHVLRFVRRWGPLGLCLEHGLPHGLLPRGFGVSDQAPCTALRSVPGETAYADPVASYENYAAQAHALVEIAHLLQAHHRKRQGRGIPQKGVIPWDRWLVLDSLLTPSLTSSHNSMRAPDSREEVRLLAEVMWQWLRLGAVHLGWQWVPGSRPEVTVTSGHLFGGIALQTALRAAKVADLPTCEGCGRPYTPQRRRADNRFCRDCRANGRAKAIRAKDSRARHRLAQLAQQSLDGGLRE